MRHFKLAMFSTVAILGLSLSSANAADQGFTSHHLVDEEPYESYAEQLPAAEKLELREYLEYQQREPCQNYRPIPEGFVKEGCDIVREEPLRVAVVQTYEPRQPKLGKVMKDYEVHFEFDASEIEPAAGNTLNQAAQDIKRYNPRQVTVAGFTDTAGPEGYNRDLSKQRAQNVSNALTQRGVTNRVLDKKAYGENNLAVKTNDGVPLRENRRVVVQFRE